MSSYAFWANTAVILTIFALAVVVLIRLTVRRSCSSAKYIADLSAKFIKEHGSFRLFYPEVHSLILSDMVIPPAVKAHRITNYLKPYLLKMHFNNNYVSAQVMHSPTATVASVGSSQEKALREAWKQTQHSTRDVAAAAKVGKLLGERLLLKTSQLY